ncbi:EAL domain-containing protein [Vibrio sp. E150_011]
MNISKALIHTGSSFQLQYNDYLLSSAFQTIYNLNTTTPFGYELLLRCENASGDTISPNAFFDQPTLSSINKIHMDLAVTTLHVINYRAFKDNLHGKVFLNMAPNTLGYLGVHKRIWPVMIRCIKKHSISQSSYSNANVVVEIVENETSCPTALMQKIKFLKNHNFNVAIDDFGSRHSTENRLKIIQPEIVKIDIGLLQQYREGNSLPLIEAVHLIKGNDQKIVLEGIESPGDLEIARHLDIDFVQGFYLDMPTLIPQ